MTTEVEANAVIDALFEKIGFSPNAAQEPIIRSDKRTKLISGGERPDWRRSNGTSA